MNSEGSCANAIDFYAKLPKEEADVLYHIVRAGIANSHLAWVKCSSHDDVFRNGIAALSE
ncbi:hypothetical protein D3C85_1464500 [compost metagenome]